MKAFFVSFFFFLSSFLLKDVFAATDFSEDGEDGIVAVDATASEGAKNNQLATSLCQIILLLNGRTGRALAVIAILALALLFMTSKLNATVFITFIIGLAVLFGAKTIALALLPSYVSVKDADRGAVKRTPDELVRQVCPELK